MPQDTSCRSWVGRIGTAVLVLAGVLLFVVAKTMAARNGSLDGSSIDEFQNWIVGTIPFFVTMWISRILANAGYDDGELALRYLVTAWVAALAAFVLARETHFSIYFEPLSELDYDRALSEVLLSGIYGLFGAVAAFILTPRIAAWGASRSTLVFSIAGILSWLLLYAFLFLLPAG